MLKKFYLSCSECVFNLIKLKENVNKINTNFKEIEKFSYKDYNQNIKIYYRIV